METLAVVFSGHKRNYTTEAVNMLCIITCDFPAHIAYIAVHNCGVNMSGVEGRVKPLDQLNEHYNLCFLIHVATNYDNKLNTVDVCSMIKEAMRSSGANATRKHLEKRLLYVPCFY